MYKRQLIGTASAEECIVSSAFKNVDVLPANMSLAGAEIELIGLEPVSYTHLDVYKRQAIGTGQTIEQAKEDAINQLGLSAEDEYQIEIIELPHKKTLGIFGGSPAKVRVYIDDGETENNDIFDVKQEIKNSLKSESDENKEEIKSDVKLEPVYSIEEAEKAVSYTHLVRFHRILYLFHCRD